MNIAGNTSTERAIPAPQHYPDNAEFWAGTAAGRLRLPYCCSCGKPHWYPRAQCPLCMGAQTEWRDAAGTGAIYTFSVSRRVGPVPFVIAYVRLDEGVTLLTNIVDCDFDSLRIGDRVRLVMKASGDGTMVPMFTPTAAALP